jgi:hypothetical protein
MPERRGDRPYDPVQCMWGTTSTGELDTEKFGFSLEQLDETRRVLGDIVDMVDDPIVDDRPTAECRRALEVVEFARELLLGAHLDDRQTGQLVVHIMRLCGTPMSQVNPNTMKGPGDFSPPEHDGPTCCECGGEAEVVRCLEEDCGHEKGYEDLSISAYEDWLDDVDWDYELRSSSRSALISRLDRPGALPVEHGR